MGKGNYDIANELAESALTSMRKIAEKHMSQIVADRQADQGTKALAEVIKQNSSMFRLPGWFSALRTATNEALANMQRIIGDKTMKTLSEAMTDPKKAAKLLETLPAAERNRVLQIMADPNVLKPSVLERGIGAARTATPIMINNALNPENNNAFAE